VMRQHDVRTDRHGFFDNGFGTVERHQHAGHFAVCVADKQPGIIVGFLVLERRDLLEVIEDVADCCHGTNVGNWGNREPGKQVKFLD
jgi:hypothetical protein